MVNNLEKKGKWSGAQQNQQNDLCAQWNQIRLSIHPVWSACTELYEYLKDPMLLHADSKDSAFTERMHGLIEVFAGHFDGFVMPQLIWL